MKLFPASEKVGGCPLADTLHEAAISCDVVGDAGAVNYIHGAIHSSWDVATEL